MKKFLILALALWITVTVYAGSSSFGLSRIQKNRLNAIVKQLKIPFGEYKLTVQSSWATIENLIMPTPEIQIVEKEKVVTETKNVEVPKEIIKEVIVEKILPDPRVTKWSVILTPADIELIRYCWRTYWWSESLEIKARRWECLEKFFLQKWWVYLEI
jgi:hypothetical protein